jgi:hypothetical protein
VYHSTEHFWQQCSWLPSSNDWVVRSCYPHSSQAANRPLHSAFTECSPLFRICLSQQAAEERHAAAVAALKQGWAAELKRQAANWEAAAAAKQEAWRTAKVAEIKEQTVKVCGAGRLSVFLCTLGPPAGCRALQAAPRNLSEHGVCCVLWYMHDLETV